MVNIEIFVRVFIQVQQKSMMTMFKHTKLLLISDHGKYVFFHISRDSIFLQLWIIILEALRKCMVKKLKLLRLFLGPTL